MESEVLSILKKYIKLETIVLEKPKRKEFGHFATPASFSLAKEFKKSPKLIADELSKDISKERHIFEKVEAINGFLNFKLSETFLNEYATWVIENPNEFGKAKNCETILLEFVSANPTGPLHIGHARGAVVGDALLRIGRHLGYQIQSEYYINDAGSQIYLLGLSIFLAGKEHILKENVEYPEQYYRGEYIVDLAKEASSEFSNDIFKKESSIEILSNFGKERMLKLIKSNLQDIGVVFDNFVSEKSLYSRWESTLEKLTSNLATYKKDGKIWLNSEKFGDEKDRVVVRENSEPTYLAGDIIYHDDKFQRNFNRYINIWGADHHGYIARVKSAIKFLGYDESHLEIILSQMVALLKNKEPYKMSKRAGNFILMSDVVKEIGQDALRFIFLSKKCDTHLEFDVEDLKKEDSSNPIFYINYAYARINSIFEKSKYTRESVTSIELENLSNEAKDLLFNSLKLPKVLEDSFNSRQINKVTDYLKELASEFHKFYNENRVLDSEDEAKFLKIFNLVSISIRVGLNLLGISPKERM